MVGTETYQRLFLLRPKPSVRSGKGEKLVKFCDRLLFLFCSQNVIDLFAPLWIEQFNARFGQVFGRLIETGPEELSNGIARLIFQRKLFLPPPQELAAMLLNQLVGRILLRVEAETLVGIGRFILAPTIPFVGIVGKGGWKYNCTFHHQATRRDPRLAAACATSLGARPVFRSIETLARLPLASTETSRTWLALYSYVSSTGEPLGKNAGSSTSQIPSGVHS